MNITPDQARELLNGTTPGPWGHYIPTSSYDPEHKYPIFGDVPGDEVGSARRQDYHLASAAPELAQTIAGMREEYGVEQATGTTQWFRSRPMAEAHAQVHGCFRLVRRLVGPVEEAE